MKNNIRMHIGNLARTTTEDELRREFEAFGEVESVEIIRDNSSGVSKGFAFIEMPVRAEGYAAIEGLKGRVLNFRTLDVTEANSRPGGKKGGKPRRRRGRF